MKYAGKIFIALALVAVLLGGCGLPSGRNQAARPANDMEDTRSVRTSKFYGNILRHSNGQKTLDHFAEYWNQVTIEDSGKWKSAQPQQNRYNLDKAIEAYNYARLRGYPFKFHCLLWGADQGIPTWFEDLSDSKKVDAIDKWFEKVFKTFPKMHSIDVVNEPIFMVNNTSTEPIFAKCLGGGHGDTWDWVVKAYEMAYKWRRQYAPKCKLLINEYAIINSTSGSTKYKAYKKIIGLLKDEGYIDGIGLQCHHDQIGGNQSIATMKNALDDLWALSKKDNKRVPIYLSEVDISKSDDDDQKTRYMEVFVDDIIGHEAVKGVTFWGYVKSETWKSNTHLLNSDNTERPALSWLKENYLYPKAHVVCVNAYYSSTWKGNRNHLYSYDDGSVCLLPFAPTVRIPYTDYQWTFVPMKTEEGEGNYGRLKSRRTGLYLSITNTSATSPTVVCEARRTNDDQRWIVERLEEGCVLFKNKRCGKYLRAKSPADSGHMPTLVCSRFVYRNQSERETFLWRFE